MTLMCWKKSRQGRAQAGVVTLDKVVENGFKEKVVGAGQG